MEYYSTLLVLIISLTIFLKIIKKQSPKNLPPGPPKLPLIGNLHQLASKNSLPHHRLAVLARVHGPIMHLQLGEVPTVVISSPEMAKEVLKTHDSVLCSRPKMLMPTIAFFDCSDIALCHYGDYWRQVRKIATAELFTSRRIQEFRGSIEDAVMDFVNDLIHLPKEEGEDGASVVNLTARIFSLNFDIILRLAINKKGEQGEEFRKISGEMAALVSGFSIGDLYPSLEFISTISGMKRKLRDLVKRQDKIIDPIIKEHLFDKDQCKKVEGDLIDILLKFHNNDGLHEHDDSNKFSLTTDNIKAIVWELFGAAGETTSATIGWIICELLKNPTAMKKAQDEVRFVLPEKELMIDEASLEKLKFLKLVIKETLRLHPPAPCLVPRESLERCEINGYEIPPKTRVFVNAWAIGRDPRYWKDPNMFIPERFENSSIDYKGTHYELIPFGAGRRICPGMGLGIAKIELILAMLLYHFDWKLPHGSEPDELNMDETFGIVGKRKDDLYVIPILNSISGFK